MTSYFIKIIGASRDQVVLTFSICCITAPVMGVLVGGMIVDKCGGYRGKNILCAMRLCLLFATLCLGVV